MKIWMAILIDVGEKFDILGEDLNLGDIVYLWSDRHRGGLGNEIIWGTAEIISYIGNGKFRAKRIV